MNVILDVLSRGFCPK